MPRRGALSTDEIPALVKQPWKARIERGDFGYYIHLSSGIIGETLPHYSWTAKGAIRKARRLIAKRNARQAQQHWTLTE